jgi:hypothetical protein
MGNLKLGWTVYETIGMGIINPRALSCIILTYRSTTITIKDLSVTIEGTTEEAAMALADHILKDMKRDANIKYFSYRSIEAYLIEGNVVVNPKIQNVMDSKQWDILKKETEKICNNLKAFM